MLGRSSKRSHSAQRSRILLDDPSSLRMLIEYGMLSPPPPNAGDQLRRKTAKLLRKQKV